MLDIKQLLDSIPIQDLLDYVAKRTSGEDQLPLRSGLACNKTYSKQNLISDMTYFRNNFFSSHNHVLDTI